MMRALLFGTLLGALLAIVPSPCRAEREWGLYVSGGRVPFSGSSKDSRGDKSPEFGEMFDVGRGARIGVYRKFLPNIYWEAGLLYETWGGKSFSGELLPQGGTFSDLSVTGAVAGLKIRFLEEHSVHVTTFGHAGVVEISGVDMTVEGQRRPYWDSTRSVSFDVGVGLEFRLSRRVTLSADVRLETFGSPEPDPQSPIRADSYESLSYPLMIGVEILLNSFAPPRPAL